MTRKPLEETYDNELLVALSDMEKIIFMMKSLCNKSLPYSEWPCEYKIIDEFILITSIFRKTLDEEINE